MTRAYRKWTDAEGETARAMRAAGQTHKAIGKELVRSDKSVSQFLFKDGGGFNRLGRTCSACPAPITDTNRAGRCRACNLRAQNSDPAFKALRLAALLSCPHLQAGAPTRLAAARKAAVTRMSNPAYVAWLRETMRTVVGPASRTPAALARHDRVAAGRKISDTRLAWCPPHYRDDYRFLLRQGIVATEAQAMVRAQIEADKPKVVILSPFERQDRALHGGAAVVANVRADRFAA